MIGDIDTSVVTNAIFVLQELGTFSLDRDLLLQLLNRIHEFNEHGLSLILSLLTKYTPSSDEEMYSIMNLLDPILRTTHSGNVLATVHAFFQLTKHKANRKEMTLRILERVKSPIMALFAGGSHETNYALLRHLQLLVTMNPRLFANDFREFFVRYNEPSFIKYEKLKILPQLVTENNIGDIVEELEVYVSDVDLELSRKSIHALGQIVPRCPNFSHIVFEKIVQLLQYDIGHVKQEATITLIQAVRKMPSLRYLFIPQVSFCFKKNDHVPSKAALVWFVGEYGNFHPSSQSSSKEEGEERVTEVVDAPYILETLIDTYEEQAPEVKLQLLSATMKLFFGRPPEVQSMLGRLLAVAIEEDSSNQAVRDRALLYYRLLLQGPDVASSVLNPNNSPLHNQPLTTFCEEKNEALRSVIFDQFNSLSVIYGKAASSFTPPECLSEEEQTEQRDVFGLGGEMAEQEAHQPQPQSQSQPHESVNLLFGDDDFTPSPSQHTQQQMQRVPTAPFFSLEGPTLSSANFQEKWKQISSPQALSFSTSLPSPDSIPQKLTENQLLVVASGQLPTLIKIFCYSYISSSSSSSSSLLDFGLEEPTQEVALFLIEGMKEGGQVNVTLKTNASEKDRVLSELEAILS